MSLGVINTSTTQQYFLVLCKKLQMQKTTNILIVNDKPQNGYTLVEILCSQPQYVLRSASTIGEALEQVADFSPEIIVIFIFKNGIDGHEACIKIREENLNSFPKIILISDHCLIEDRLKGYAAGADDFIAQPFLEAELLAKLKVYSKLQRIEELEVFKTTALNLLCHETRTPLNGIMLGSELLSEVEDLPQSAKTYIEMVESCGRKIQQLLEKISRYCTIKEGVTLNLEEKCICESIQVVVQTLSVEKHPIIRVSCDRSIRFFADWKLLREVFSYILNNSIKHGPLIRDNSVLL